MSSFRIYCCVAVFLLNLVCGPITEAQVFELSSTTFVFENENTPTLRPFESSATIKLTLLKQEMFHKLFSVQVDQCTPISCEADTTDYLVLFENETIRGVYGKLDNTSQWSVGLAFVNLLQPRLDVPRIYVNGICSSNNQKVDEKTTIREISFCKYGSQNSISPALSVVSSYNQKVVYDNKNSMLNGLTAEETYKLDVPLYPKATTQIVTKHVLTKKSDEQVPASDTSCDSGIAIQQCLDNLITKLKYKFISESAEKLLTAFMLNRFIESKERNENLECGLGTEKEFQHLNEHPNKSAAKSFLKILKRARRATEDQLLTCLNSLEDKETVFRHALISVLAASGTTASHNAVKKFTAFDPANTDETWWTTYLTMLGHAPLVDQPVVEDVVNSLSTSNPVDRTLALSAAYILRRHCLKVAGCEDRSGPTKKLISVFEEKFKSCQSDDRDCVLTMVRSFANLRTPHVVPLVKQYLCGEKTISVEVLRLFKVLHRAYWCTSEIISELLRIYANHCPLAQDQTQRILAADLLLMSYEDKTKLVENLLKINRTTSGEREIFSYVLARIKYLASIDDRIEEGFREFAKKSNIFNYDTLATGAQSTVVKEDFFEAETYRTTYELDMEFNKGILKTSAAELRLEPYDSSSTLLLSIGLFTEGLETVASSVGAIEETEEPSGTEEDSTPSPIGGMRLVLFENQQYPVTLFDGEGDLMSAVWSANGDNITAFANTFLVNDLRNALPLLNGYTLNADLQSALSLKLTGSIEVSIWYRTSHSVIANEGGFVLGGRVSLHSTNRKTIFNNDFGLSTEVGVNFVTDLDFYSNPFKMCLQLDQIPFSLKLAHFLNYRYKASHKLFSLDESAGKKSLQHWKRTNVRRFEGRCFATLSKMFKSCLDLDN